MNYEKYIKYLPTFKAIVYLEYQFCLRPKCGVESHFMRMLPISKPESHCSCTSTIWTLFDSKDIDLPVYPLRDIDQLSVQVG